MIVEIRCVASGDYVAPAAVALHSFLRHNPWFEGDLVVHCGPGEVDRVSSALAFLPRCGVVPVSEQLRGAIADLALDENWVPERFWGLDALADPADGDVLLLDADTCTVGSMEALCSFPGAIVACGEGAAHRGHSVDRVTNAFAEPADSTDLIAKTFNSGVVRISGAVLGADLFERALDVLRTAAWNDLTRRQHDQFVLNRLFEDAWCEADPSFNLLLRHAGLIRERRGVGVADARLLHFNVDPRPWQADRSERIADRPLAAATLQWLEAHGAVVEARSLTAPDDAIDRLRAPSGPRIDTPRFYGIEHPLDTQISTHLFVLSPNNSGSTFLKNALRASSSTWNLDLEGQRTFGYVGPRGWDSNRQLIWAAEPEWVEEYVEPANFDWEVSRRAWYAQAVARDPRATVMIEKSPPFLLLPQQLVAAFVDAKFVLMVRDPYATFEGIIRRRVPNPPNTDDDPRVLAAQHVMACFERQRENIAALAGRSTFFTYETLCADPGRCARQLTELVPALADIDLDRRVPVKGMYDERLRNMNDDQLANLTDDDCAVATAIFEGHRDTIESFGYELR